ncbi:MAG: adenylate kinase [Bacillota bacterium]
MIILIGGASCSGKTFLAQKLLEKYKFPYLSIDHLKMGLIRSDNAEGLTPYDDKKLTAFLWPIIKEIIKTNIENNQSIIIEGCYLPQKEISSLIKNNKKVILSFYIVFSKKYIDNNYLKIINKASVIENKEALKYLTKKYLYYEHKIVKEKCIKYNLPYIFIKEDFQCDIKQTFKLIENFL